MIKAIVLDFSRVILLPKDKSYAGGLNALYDAHFQDDDYRFSDYFEFNDQLLQALEGIKDVYSLHVFTTGHVQNTPEVQKRISGVFKSVHSVEDIPFDKSDPEGYQHIATTLGYAPQEVLYIDDQLKNIKVARQAGFDTLLFESNEALFRDLKLKGIVR